MGLRIVLASDHYPPFIGGAQRQVHLLAHELTQRGHEVAVATVWHPDLPLEENDAGVQLFRARQLRSWQPGARHNSLERHSPPFPDPVTVWELWRLINRFQPDVVHSSGWITYSMAVALLGRRTPLILSGRDTSSTCATTSMLYHDRLCTGPRLTKCLGCAMGYYGSGPKGALTVLGVKLSKSLLRRRVDGLHSVSAFVQNIFEHDLFGTDHPRLERNQGPVLERVIPSFLVDVDEPAGKSDFIQRLPREPYILYVGSLQLRKGLVPLMTAYSRLKAPPPLVVIGYKAWGALESYPPGVSVLTNIAHADVMTAWQHCLFGVIPSLVPDASPGVIREAISQGKAVIGTRIGGTPEMLRDNETGLLVAPGDVDALAAAMQRLIADADLRDRLGGAAREQAGRYRASVVVPQFEQLYAALLSGTSRLARGGRVASPDES
jgi:glycosyltransferase involved in cell wall biosynthesis